MVSAPSLPDRTVRVKSKYELPNGRVQKRGKKTESFFKWLGIIGAWIFFLGILVGLYGICYRCPYMTDFTFYEFYY